MEPVRTRFQQGDSNDVEHSRITTVLEAAFVLGQFPVLAAAYGTDPPANLPVYELSPCNAAAADFA